MIKIALIGSTGSIGKQVLNVVRRNPDRYKIVSLACANNVDLLCEQIKEFNPKVATCNAGSSLLYNNKNTEFFFGENSFTNAIINEADIVVISLVGYAGFVATVDAVNKGKNVALANKESLVVGGDFIMKLAREKCVKIVPIDSEHSAIWQALNFDFTTPFNKIILTCSGGAFRDKSLSELDNVTSLDALKHPNWLMGKKITVDCATLVNKGFEVIEAHHLYNCSFDKIDVIIHRESIIHSMVEFNDGAVIAQMSYPTMELPISMALSYPERLNVGLNSLDFTALKSLSFSEYDETRFPAMKLIIDAGKIGGLYPAVANGANEQAVSLFLQDKISFKDITNSISGALSSYKDNLDFSLDNVKFADEFGRSFVKTRFGE